MNKIVEIEEAIEIARKLKEQKKSIVLAGGCFDILHIGHISFLREAKKQGDFLFVLLESDSRIKKIKGTNRPINSQKGRAIILAKLPLVNCVVPLPELKNNKDYDNLINSLKPDIIATTKGDPNISHKKRQAKMINAKLIEVIDRVSDQSTTKLSKLISNKKA